MPTPGPRTDDLGFYLFLQGIPATFFVIGERAASEPELCLQLARWGHLVVNHTQTHSGMPGQATQALIDNVLDANTSMGNAVNPDSLLLRPPYGAWSDSVASILNGNSDARKYTGPVMWDIPGANPPDHSADWEFWRDGMLANVCAATYHAEINAVRKGIVLMHDCAPSFDSNLVNNNRTYEMTQLLIPLLVADGYRFVRLDAVPQIRSAMQVSSLIALKAAMGYVSPQDGGGGAIFANGPAPNAWEELGLVEMGNGKQAIRTPNGQFMSTQPNGEVLANGNGIYDWEVFELIVQGNGTVAIQAHTGNYVSAPSAGQIMATAGSVGSQEQFILEPIA